MALARRRQRKNSADYLNETNRVFPRVDNADPASGFFSLELGHSGSTLPLHACIGSTVGRTWEIRTHLILPTTTICFPIFYISMRSCSISTYFLYTEGLSYISTFLSINKVCKPI